MIKNETEAINWIHSLTNTGERIKHDTQERMLTLLNKLGHPEKKAAANYSCHGH